MQSYLFGDIFSLKNKYSKSFDTVGAIVQDLKALISIKPEDDSMLAIQRSDVLSSVFYGIDRKVVSVYKPLKVCLIL